ncbi:unnamed protein product [Rotaria sp. Silwood1]|nr:unnamed protein product [Rotaria sp. Silwood1]
MNSRVMRWSRRNGTSGEVIIKNISCWGLTMDDQRFLYIVGDDKVTRCRMGETNETVVAGDNGYNDRLNQLNFPTYVFVDREYSVYVSDKNNHRVMKWMKDAKEGIIVVGGRGEGNDLTQLSQPRGIFVDQMGTLYVADYENDRVMRWYKGETQGDVIAGGKGIGEQANQLSRPEGLSFDRHGNLYVADCINNRVQRFSIEK